MRAINANGWEVAMNKSAASLQPSKPETLQDGARSGGDVKANVCLVYGRGCSMPTQQTWPRGPPPCCRGVGFWTSPPPAPCRNPLPTATLTIGERSLSFPNASGLDLCRGFALAVPF